MFHLFLYLGSFSLYIGKSNEANEFPSPHINNQSYLNEVLRVLK